MNITQVEKITQLRDEINFGCTKMKNQNKQYKLTCPNIAVVILCGI